MAGLAPTLGSSIGFEQPVETPSQFSGAASLVGGFLDSLGAPSGGAPSQTDIVAADKGAFYDSLARGRAAIEQGRTSAGNRMITEAYRGFARKYGREHDDVNTAFQDATGVSFDIETTGNAVDIEQIASTPEFNIRAAALQQQFPDATPDEIFGMAAKGTVDQAATDLRIAEIEQMEKVNWYEVERTYVDKATQAGDLIRGLLRDSFADQVLTPDEVGQIQGYYDQMFGSILKPAGVNQDKWDKFQEEYVQPLNTVVSNTLGAMAAGSLDAPMANSLKQIVNKAVAQGKLSPQLLISMNQSSAGDYDSFVRLLEATNKDERFLEGYNFVTGASYEELVNWVTEFENKTDIDQLQIDTREFDALDDKTKRESILNGSTLLSPSAGPEQIAVNLLNTNAKFEALGTRALSPSDFGAVFGPSYFEGVKKVFESNPVIGRQIAQQAADIVNGQKIEIGRALNSEANQLGFQIVEGKLIVNPETIDPGAQEIVDRHFNGSWEEAIAADGRIAGAHPSAANNAQIRRIISTIRKDLLPKVRKFQQATAAVDQLSERYLTEDVVGKTPEAATAAPEGGLEGRVSSKDVGGSATSNSSATRGSTEDQGSQYSVPEDVAGDQEFMTGVSSVANNIGANPNDLLRIMGFETGGSFDPGQKNLGGSSATGLIQFMDFTAKELGTTTEALANMSRTEQLAYVERYFKGKLGNVKNPNLSDLYMAVLWPRAVGKDENYVLWEEGSEEYTANSGLDMDGNGTVTKGEAVQKVLSATGGESFNRDMPAATSAPLIAERPLARDTLADPIDSQVARAANREVPEGVSRSEVQQSRQASAGRNEGRTSTKNRQAEQVWGQLSSQTQKMLTKLFGNEEGAREAIAKGEITEEDLA